MSVSGMLAVAQVKKPGSSNPHMEDRLFPPFTRRSLRFKSHVIQMIRQSLNSGFCHVLEIGVITDLCSSKSKNISIVTQTLMSRLRYTSAFSLG